MRSSLTGFFRIIDMRIGVIIQRFCLRRPIYSHLSCGGHFGLNAKDMPWEQADIAQELINSLH